METFEIYLRALGFLVQGIGFVGILVGAYSLVYHLLGFIFDDRKEARDDRS